MRNSRADQPPQTPSAADLLNLAAFLLVCTSLLMGCDVISQYGRYRGITLIASRGQPTADRVIWSRTQADSILVSASEVGFGFALDGSEVFILDVDTGKRTSIAKTERGTIDGETWSPDGQQVVLNISSATKGYERYKGLWIWDARTHSMKFLSAQGQAFWSPSDGVIAIIESSDSKQEELLRLTSGDTNLEETITLGNINSDGYIWGIDWSPDGKRLVLARGDPRLSIAVNLFIYDLENRQLTRLTSDGDNYHPAWSPQGTRIAFIEQADGRSSQSLHLVNTDGSCDIEFPFIDWAQSPTWSPDGERLAFVGPDGIYALNVNEFLRTYKPSSLCP